MISSDTVVIGADGMILEKPRDFEHAKQMLSSLSGTKHRVVSGVVIYYRGSEAMKRKRFSESTAVEFSEVSTGMIACMLHVDCMRVACMWYTLLPAFCLHVCGVHVVCMSRACGMHVACFLQHAWMSHACRVHGCHRGYRGILPIGRADG